MSAARRLTADTPWTLDLDSGLSRPIDDACVGVATQLDHDRLLHLAVTQSLRHVVQKNGFTFDRELIAAQGLITAPELLRDHPVCAILAPDDISVERAQAATLVDLPFFSSRQKREVMAGVGDTLSARYASRTLIEDVLSVTDELFTNAIYNAPFVDLKTGANPGISRVDPAEIRYPADLAARLIVAADDTRLIVGCADPFGSLNLRRYLHRIKETYVRGAAATHELRAGRRGAWAATSSSTPDRAFTLACGRGRRRFCSA